MDKAQLIAKLNGKGYVCGCYVDIGELDSKWTTLVWMGEPMVTCVCGTKRYYPVAPPPLRWTWDENTGELFLHDSP